MPGIQGIQQCLQYALYFFLALAAIDGVKVWLRRRGNPRESLANFGVFAVGKVWRDYVSKGVELSILVAVAQLAPSKLPTTWWAVGLTILAADFVYYWKHRTEHGVRILWAFHSVHHSSEEFNLTTAFRLPWFGGIIGTFFYLPLVLVGFDPLLVMLARQVVLLYQFWIHTDAVGGLGWFDGVFNSPANHRVHHGSNDRYLDKNHGGILILWDRLFGTYQPELRADPVVYGLTHPIGTRSPLAINLREPAAIARLVSGATTPKEALGYVFRGPGWTPGGAAEL